MRDKLEKYFGYTEFRPVQAEIIQDILDGKDTLALIPTGGGKSLCYQYPAVVRPGLTVVISPLIALMKDQVDDLISKKIPAACLNSSLEREAIDVIKNEIRHNRLRLLYVAPERVTMPGFLEFLQKSGVNLFAVDEAHCISEWGHDFRPDYRKLNVLKKQFPGVAILALTSTAVEEVQEDIMSHLRFRSKNVYKTSFDRPNLFYSVLKKGKDNHTSVISTARRRNGESGIVYCFSRKGVDSMCRKLNDAGLSAAPYHAGLAPEERINNQDRFSAGDIRIIVATIAFGMGIDKPDIRYVIHADMPKSIEGYFQETGRAGRDGLPSDCILFYGPGDRVKQEYFIRQIDDLRHQAVSRQKLKQMVSYCGPGGCRRRFLLAYFSEGYAKANCGACDSCVPDRQMTGVPLDAKSLERPAPAAGKRKSPEQKKGPDYDSELYALLRSLRNDIAERQFKKPFMVFPNNTLKELAKHKPASYVEFARVKGVGGKKMQQYGDIFVGFIARYCKDAASVLGPDGKALFMGIENSRAKASAAFWTDEEDRILLFGFKRGKSVREIAGFLDRTVEEIKERLSAKRNLMA